MTNQEFIESIRLEGEEWRDVVGWNRYAVSSLGRVAAYSAPYKCGSRICKREPQILHPILNNKTPHYYKVRLSDGNGKRRLLLVHRLVADAFLPNPDRLPFVNHKDENPNNNCIENLEWCTQKYNCNYGTHNVRMAKTLSETAYQRRSVVQLSLNGEYIMAFPSIKDAADKLGIERASISICCRKPNRTGKGYRWMYLSDYESLVSMSKNELPNLDNDYPQ